MFRELFLFELYYRRRRAATYVYFLLIFFICLIAVVARDTEIGAGRNANATFIITAFTALLTVFYSIITASIVGVSIIRDYDHGMTPILFTSSVTKGGYLFGRLFGSLTVAIVLHLAMIPGFMAGYMIGPFVPWDVAWRNREMMPFDLWVYVQPFLLFTITNIFVTGSLFFCVGALVKKPIVIYSQSIFLIMIYQIANIVFLSNPESQRMAAIADPFAIHTVIYMTRYWTPAQQNTFLVPFEDVMLYNRLLWIGIAVLTILFTYWRFSFSSRRSLIRKREKVEATDTMVSDNIPLPVVHGSEGVLSQTKQVFLTGVFYLRGIWKEVPFLVIAGTCVFALISKAINMDDMYGTSSYPTTGAVIFQLLDSVNLFFLILLIFYSGEVVWKERQQKIHAITDATPIASATLLLSKFLGLALMFLMFLAGILIFGILLQAARGYYEFDLQAYLGSLFFDSFLSLCLLSVLALLIQVLSGNKFTGFIATIATIVILFLVAPPLGLEHDLISYGSGSLGVFSEMNGFGHFVRPFIWLKTYWIAFAVLMLIPAVILMSRTTESGFRIRWKAGRDRFTGGLRTTAAIMAIVFVTTGGYIYYNTSILNNFESSREIKAKQSRYERELKQSETMVQPRIVEVNINIDLFPGRRSFKATGYYYLKNRDSVPIGNIQVQRMNSGNLNLHDVGFGRTANLVEEKPDLGYQLYEIDPPLHPGDSLKMDFAIDFIQDGFKGKGINTDVVYNGTFFRNDYFPSIGYDRDRELTSREDRRRFALNARQEQIPASDLQGQNSFGKEADRIRFKAQLSTDSSQIAIAPGELVKEWYENKRHYLQYQAKTTIPDFYAILSGRYQVLRDNWNDVALEIYYHPDHHYNVARMMQGLKDGLTYYTKNFGPFPQSQLRIVEFPRYSTLAQSYPGMIAFSEAAGFILKVADPATDLDVPYYVTAHELAHQWWGQQVIEADRAGKSVLSEGMAQYSALMVMTHAFSPEMMQLFLKYELNSYLKGRSAEKMSEVPLMSADGQQYISYNKSALAFFAIQDYIGEDSLNSAFRRFYQKWAFKGPPYPSSDDLIDEISKVTPDSLKYLITDLFDHITLYENTTQQAAYRPISQGRFEITMTVSTQKLQVDNKGKETAVPINDWIDVGVYGKNENGKEKLIYLKKHKFTREKNTLTIVTGSEPVKVGIDPLHKLIDHHSNDNVISVGTVVELANSPLGY